MISTIVTTASGISNPAIDLHLNTTTSNYLYTPSSTIDVNATNFSSINDTSNPVFPSYIRTTSMVFCIIIMCLGVIGNVMVPIVIFKTKDMRNSTNIFLVNLSVADLMVLLVCTPTVLVEVNSRPETWVLGEEMCKAVPFVELTVAHASVLTILAISFERYYAICKPLKAGYICTKTRASFICLSAWFVAAVFTSPILGIAEYHQADYFDGSKVPACHTLANTFWSALFFLSSIVLFFVAPFFILLVLYCIIAKNLISNAATLVLNKHIDNYSVRARRQVILMLGTVVLSFFVCLIPFRVLTLWIIVGPEGNVYKLGIEKYYNILYFCRIMVYLNSAINPILYNLMSSKFRSGFQVCSGTRRKFYFKRSRNGTFSTTTTANSCRSSTLRNSHEGFKVCYRPRNSSILIKHCDSPDSFRSNASSCAVQNNSPVVKGKSGLRKCNEGCEFLEPEVQYNDSRHYSVVSENVVIYPDVYDKDLKSRLVNNGEISEEVIDLHEKLAKTIRGEDESFV